MATYTGQDGSLSIEGLSIANLRSWSVDFTTNTIESTVMGLDSKTFKPGMNEWSGSADVYYDPAVIGDGASGSLVEDSLNEVVAFIGYPSTSGAGDPKISGNVIITGISVNSTMDGMVEASISFQGTGDITIGVGS